MTEFLLSMQGQYKEPMMLKELDNKNKLFTNPIFVVISACLCCALWGSATPFIKMGYRVIYSDFPNSKPDVPSTILFAGVRFALAGLITIIIYSIARRKVLYPKPANIGRIALVGLVQTVIQYFFFYIGLANTTGEKGTVLSGSSSFFSILISTLIFRQEKLSIKKIVACIVGFAGIIAINLEGLDFSFIPMGDGFVIMSAVSLGFSSVLIKIFSKHEDPVVISGYQFMAGGVVMIIVGALFDGVIRFNDIKSVLIILYLAFLSAVAYALWGVLLKYNPVSKVTIFSFMTPVFGVILTKVMLPDESKVDALNLIIALLLVCIGVFMLNYTRRVKTQK